MRCEGTGVKGIARIGAIRNLRFAGVRKSARLDRGSPPKSMSSSVDAPSGPPPDRHLFIVVRNNDVVPKERRVERLPSGYSVRELCDVSEGHYWVVVAALEVA